MGSQVQVYKGVNLEVIEVDLDAVDTSYDATTELAGQVIPFLHMSDADAYTARVNTDGSYPSIGTTPGYTTLKKDAGTACSVALYFLSLDARAIG